MHRGVGPHNRQGSVSDALILLIQNAHAAPAGVAEALARLRNRHYVIAESHTLADGLVEVRDRKFAAIILELTLPDTSGLPAFLRLQSKAATVPVSNRPDSRSTGPSKVSRRRNRSGPRNQAASGTANPCFGR